MMQECPKCGFVQPADRYCAQCGLDIEHYKPAPPSLVKKLVSNTYFHLGILLIVVGTVVGSIYLEQKSKIIEHLKMAAQGLPLSSPTSSSATNTTATNTATETDPQSTATAESNAETTANSESSPQSDPTAGSSSATDAATESKNNLSTEVNGAAPQNKTANSPNATANAKSKNLVITFAETPSILLQQWFSEGQMISEMGQRRAILISNLEPFEKIKERDPDFRILPGGQSKGIRLNTPTAFDFAHITASNEEVGLNFDLIPTAQTNTQLEVSLDGHLHLRDEKLANLINQELTGQFAFSPNSSLLLVGYLPHQSISAEDQEFFVNTPLVIYDSLAFINGMTEFVIFIQAK